MTKLRIGQKNREEDIVYYIEALIDNRVGNYTRDDGARGK